MTIITCLKCGKAADPICLKWGNRRCADCKTKERRENYIANAEQLRARAQAWRFANPEKVKAYSDAYSAAHREELSRKQCERTRLNPAPNRFKRSLRRAAEKRAMPPWADRKRMLAFYVRAAELTSALGIDHHVDHIYPLQSKLACGLHYEGNLQIVPAIVNQKKTNKQPGEVGQPLCCAWPSVVHFEATVAQAIQSGVPLC
jgi:hypothetical protein